MYLFPSRAHRAGGYRQNPPAPRERTAKGSGPSLSSRLSPLVSRRHVTTPGTLAGLVIVVLLAGCFGAPGKTPTPDRTRTTARPASSVGNAPPEDVDALLASHGGSMTDARRVTEVQVDGVTTGWAYVGDGSRLTDRMNDSTTADGNDTVAVQRATEGGDVTCETIPTRDLSVDGVLLGTQLRERLANASYERNGTTPCTHRVPC